MENIEINGVSGMLDRRFLAKSLGLLNPAAPLEIERTASVREAIELLRKHRVGCVVVTDEQGRLVGIFSERDVLLKIVLTEIDIDNTQLSSVMTANPHTAKMTTTIAFALTMMSQGGFRHIPITDDREIPVGIVSVKDIVDFLAQGICAP